MDALQPAQIWFLRPRLWRLVSGIFAGLSLLGDLPPAQAAPAAVTRPRIVLMSSFKMPKKAPIYLKPYYKDYLHKLERALLREIRMAGLEDQVELLSLPAATAHQAWETLRAPQNLAVFWVSHAGATDLGLSGISGPEIIADSTGANVRGIFEAIHPNTQFLGVVGCQNALVIQSLLKKGAFSANPQLEVAAFDQKIEPKPALREAFARFLGVLKSHPEWLRKPPNTCPRLQGVPLIVRRNLGGAPGERFPAVRVEIGKRLLAVLPEAGAGATQAREVWIDSSMLGSAQSLKIVVDTGLPLRADRAEKIGEFSFGDFESKEPWPGASWKLFAKADGTPVGQTFFVYQFKGKLAPPELKLETFEPYPCLTGAIK